MDKNHKSIQTRSARNKRPTLNYWEGGKRIEFVYENNLEAYKSSKSANVTYKSIIVRENKQDNYLSLLKTNKQSEEN